MNDRDESIVLAELNELIVELAILRAQGDEGDMPSDWIMVADVNNLSEGDTKDGYYIMTMRTKMPVHSAKGLFKHGYDLLFNRDENEL